MTRHPFGSQTGELASVDIALALRRREQAAAAAAERVREKIRSRDERRAKLRAAFLGLLSSRRCPNDAAERAAEVPR